MNHKNYKLLVIEDEAELREYIVSVLTEELDINIVEARDGKEALELFDKHDFDAVLSDQSMPHINGLQVLQAVRAKKYEIPFVMLTAYGDNEKIYEGLRMGINDFLQKPCRAEKLIKVVTMALEIGACRRVIQKNLEDISSENSLAGQKAKESLERLANISKIHLLNSYHT